jgi:tRNA threonylcarbamoyladenosine biosynthesis protein TsaB
VYFCNQMSGISNPLILALETATPVSSVALFQGGKLLGCQEAVGEKVHAQRLTTLVSQTVSDSGFALKDIHAIAVGKGPGSYTGLRVGVSTAKGLCMALNIPLLSFESLDGLAAQVSHIALEQQARICPMIDARRMEVYCKQLNGRMETIEAVHACIVTADSFAEILKSEKMIFIGNGAEKCKSLLESVSANAIVMPEICSTARSAGDLVQQSFLAGRFEDLVTFEPFYLKEFSTSTPRNPFP